MSETKILRKNNEVFTGTRRSLMQFGLMSAVGPLGSGQRTTSARPEEIEPIRTESSLGSLVPVLRSIGNEKGFPMDYWHRNGMPVEKWRARGRGEVQSALSYSPKTKPLDLKVHSIVKQAGYEVRIVSFATTNHYRVPAYLLVPDRGKGPYPGVVALHDHGGWFYHGKEKLVQIEGEHVFLKAFRERLYEGRAIADELAKRGYVVIVTDSIYWGERRLEFQDPPADLRKRLKGLRPEQVEYVKAVNSTLAERVPQFIVWLGYCGTSWLGVINYDDRASVDVLAGLPEVDPTRIGCVGLSGGGFRATYLAGMEPRLRASVIVGWMTSLPTTLALTIPAHGGMFDNFNLHASLDHPDVASLGAPNCAIFVQDCSRDVLFTRGGMQAAIDKIRSVYEDLKQPSRLDAKFYDVPHQFNVEMQEDAFTWLDRWLRRS